MRVAIGTGVLMEQPECMTDLVSVHAPGAGVCTDFDQLRKARRGLALWRATD